MIKLFIVDDQPMIVAGIRGLLQTEDHFQVIGSANCTLKVLDLFEQNAPDVVLLDIKLPDLKGIELCGQIKKNFPQIKVLGISMYNERICITRLMENGASGYILKNIDQEELTEAIRQVAAGRMYFSIEAATALTTRATTSPVPALTGREKEVLALISEGLTNKEIADQLYISPLTVDSHRKNLLAKFTVRNTAALVKLGIEHGLIALYH